MLDEKRIKLMVKMASYEQKEGNQDINISAYARKDYTSFHTLYTLLWITLGYVVLAMLVLLVIMEWFVESLTLKSLIAAGIIAVVGYLAFLIGYGIFAYLFYRRKHNRARQRVKEYNHNLVVLSKLYEKENIS